VNPAADTFATVGKQSFLEYELPLPRSRTPSVIMTFDPEKAELNVTGTELAPPGIVAEPAR
jgi:hypothetical protein